MIPIKNFDEERKTPFLSAIVAILAGSAIVALVVVYYFVATDSFPQFIKNYFAPPKDEKIKILVTKKTQPIAAPVADKFSTKVIKYSFPLNLPSEKKDGECFSASIAQPYRQDAFRCQAENIIYDPCFGNESGDMAVCQMNPLENNIFVIVLGKPLPSIALPETTKENWAWFIELEDGTICAPYTEQGPLIDKEQAIYGCKAKIKGDLDVLIGDILQDAKIWTAKRMIVTRDGVGTGWDTKFSDIVKIKTLWK